MEEVSSSGFKPFSRPVAVALPQEAIAEFCQRWKIQEFYLFGSVLRDNLGSDSDVDITSQIVGWAVLTHMC
ncbi:MAG: nucleotidyltransferase domain-containing protein [Oculatellaceae cyanobacterium bins.114]|nr:nucleotidyltransferase domain-containing protein [Oculatellaceae cyanobacterium bins.114]